METWGNLKTTGKFFEKNFSRADVQPPLRHGCGAAGGADTELDRAEVALQTSKRRWPGSVYLQLTHWCQDAVVVSIHCSSHKEFVTVKCRPPYVLRQLTAVILSALPHGKQQGGYSRAPH